MLFKRVVDDQVETQPLDASGVTVDRGTRDLVYTMTVNNSVYAGDPNDRSATEPMWHVNFDPSDTTIALDLTSQQLAASSCSRRECLL